MKKKNLGQFFTTNSVGILQGLMLSGIRKNMRLIDLIFEATEILEVEEIT